MRIINDGILSFSVEISWRKGDHFTVIQNEKFYKSKKIPFNDQKMLGRLGVITTLVEQSDIHYVLFSDNNRPSAYFRILSRSYLRRTYEFESDLKVGDMFTLTSDIQMMRAICKESENFRDVF
jgi:hypothetical protein